MLRKIFHYTKYSIISGLLIPIIIVAISFIAFRLFGKSEVDSSIMSKLVILAYWYVWPLVFEIVMFIYIYLDNRGKKGNVKLLILVNTGLVLVFSVFIFLILVLLLIGKAFGY